MILASGILFCISVAAMLIMILVMVADTVFDLWIPISVAVAIVVVSAVSIIVAGILGITGSVIVQNDCEAQGYHYIDRSCYKGELEKLN